MSWRWFTSECPRICTLTRLCSTAASISRCAWTSWVSMCRQSSEKQFLSSTLAITDSCETILFSRYSTVSAWVYTITIHIQNHAIFFFLICTARSQTMTDYVTPRKFNLLFTITSLSLSLSPHVLIILLIFQLMTGNYTTATMWLLVKLRVLFEWARGVTVCRLMNLK